MTDRRELEKLVKEMNSLNKYTWIETDKQGRIDSVGSQAWNGGLKHPITAAEAMRELVK
jgi:hypothetical protein